MIDIMRSMISNYLNIKLIDVDLNNYTEFEFLSDTLELSKKTLIPINFFSYDANFFLFQKN